MRPQNTGKGASPKDGGGVEGLAGIDAQHPPIRELSEFEMGTDEEFPRKVQGSINRTQTATGLVDLSTRGFWGLLMDYIATIISAIFSPPESGKGLVDKEE